MKIVKRILTALTCTFAFAASAHAIPIVSTSSITHTYLDAGSATTFVNFDFDINALLAQYNATLSSITGAVLDIVFSDPNAGNEKYVVSVAVNNQTASGTGNNQVNPGHLDESVTLNLTSLGDLKADGKVRATVTATTGEFYVESATLTTEATPSAVPEPASLALLGMGLLGVGAARRRRS